MYKVIIIEDERIAADNLERMLNDIQPTSEIIARLESVREAVEILPSITCDLIFCDIHLTDGNAFEILDKITLNKPIIFTTAYDQYVLRAFKHFSIDYLLKPIGKKELEESLKKFRAHFSNLSQSKVDLESLQELLGNKNSFKSRFLVQIGKKLKPISIEQVSHFHSSNKITFLFTENGNRFTIDPSLSQLEKELNLNLFFRINRQYIISRSGIEHINMVSPTKLKVVLVSDPDLDLFVSIDRIGKFKNWLK